MHQPLAGNVPLGHCAGERVGVKIRGTFSIQPMVTRTAMGPRQVLSPFDFEPICKSLLPTLRGIVWRVDWGKMHPLYTGER